MDKISNLKKENGFIYFDYLIKGEFKESHLKIAIVEKELKNHVGRGENAKRTQFKDKI